MRFCGQRGCGGRDKHYYQNDRREHFYLQDASTKIGREQKPAVHHSDLAMPTPSGDLSLLRE
jgi:hypothetical protein